MPSRTSSIFDPIGEGHQLSRPGGGDQNAKDRDEIRHPCCWPGQNVLSTDELALRKKCFLHPGHRHPRMAIHELCNWQREDMRFNNNKMVHFNHRTLPPSLNLWEKSISLAISKCFRKKNENRLFNYKKIRRPSAGWPPEKVVLLKYVNA